MQDCLFHFNLLELDIIMQVNIYIDQETDIPRKNLFSLCLVKRCFISFLPNQVKDLYLKNLLQFIEFNGLKECVTLQGDFLGDI